MQNAPLPAGSGKRSGRGSVLRSLFCCGPARADEPAPAPALGRSSLPPFVTVAGKPSGAPGGSRAGAVAADGVAEVGVMRTLSRMGGVARKATGVSSRADDMPQVRRRCIVVG